ncbi:hypothetical protein CROQUDRAFT_77412 [Cronartium quercuum f. sp. fusiforme G11]|uniref:Uncharacterized protein n=1 Tax=Cronartium quercuum f. sp. fusiforme G11 TaxID=708437 RepID=A0A9P6NIL0_9BASI|nr:hypothetical protein CROQUDRAFT_77412 [Cronartium quercuum f. sp. fusiforme G11]
MSGRVSMRESLTWGSLLDYESTDVARQARDAFQKAQTKLAAGSGHVIAGITGNDRALACLCVFLTKSRLAPTERRAAETSLQRQSGVAPRIFSNAAKQLNALLTDTTGKARRKREPAAKSSDGVRDTLDWGTLLDCEPPNVANQARRLFKDILPRLREPGHNIIGLDGNRRAVACLSLYLAKTSGGECLTADAEEDLNRLSGVTSQIFAQASKQLRDLLGLASGLSRRDSNVLSGSAGTRKRVRTEEREQAIADLTRSSPAKRVHLTPTPHDSESDIVFSPTSSKCPRTGPSNSRVPPTHSPLRPLTSTRRTRAMEKTPLNLPLEQAPAQPMCIFESRPVLNPCRPQLKQGSSIEYDDWNWRSEIFQQNWDEADLKKWDNWIQKSFTPK